ncbi:MAG: hypothetical protein ACJ71H_18550, partial [Nitrososphaeraceae archaeon]
MNDEKTNQKHSSISSAISSISSQEQKQHSSDAAIWSIISARIRKNDLPLLNKKLEMNGFKTFNEFVRA